MLTHSVMMSISNNQQSVRIALFLPLWAALSTAIYADCAVHEAEREVELRRVPTQRSESDNLCYAKALSVIVIARVQDIGPAPLLERTSLPFPQSDEVALLMGFPRDVSLGWGSGQSPVVSFIKHS